MRTKITVDGINIFNPEKARENGFTFRGVGLGSH